MMRKLSFGLLLFAAVVVFASAFSPDNENGLEEDPVGLRAVEKSRLGRKPPGKVPGPKLIQQPHIREGVEMREFGMDRFGHVALKKNVNKKGSLLLSDNDNRKGKKHVWAFVRSDHKKDNGKKHLLDP